MLAAIFLLTGYDKLVDVDNAAGDSAYILSSCTFARSLPHEVAALRSLAPSLLATWASTPTPPAGLVATEGEAHLALPSARLLWLGTGVGLTLYMVAALVTERGRNGRLRLLMKSPGGQGRPAVGSGPGVPPPGRCQLPGCAMSSIQTRT